MVLDSREKAVENSDLHSTVLLPWSIKSIASKGTSPLINAVSNRTSSLTAAFNNRRTLKFKAQPTNAFFATVNQMFSGSSQLPTTAKVLFMLNVLITVSSAVVGSRPTNAFFATVNQMFSGCSQLPTTAKVLFR